MVLVLLLTILLALVVSRVVLVRARPETENAVRVHTRALMVIVIGFALASSMLLGAPESSALTFGQLRKALPTVEEVRSLSGAGEIDKYRDVRLKKNEPIAVCFRRRGMVRYPKPGKGLVRSFTTYPDRSTYLDLRTTVDDRGTTRQARRVMKRVRTRLNTRCPRKIVYDSSGSKGDPVVMRQHFKDMHRGFAFTMSWDVPGEEKRKYRFIYRRTGSVVAIQEAGQWFGRAEQWRKTARLTRQLSNLTADKLAEYTRAGAALVPNLGATKS